MESTITLTDQEAVQLFMSGNSKGIDILVKGTKTAFLPALVF
jgi:hypothetical protein